MPIHAGINDRMLPIAHGGGGGLQHARLWRVGVAGGKRFGATMRPWILAALVLLAVNVAGRAQAAGAVASQAKAECDPPSKAALAHANSCAAAVARWRKCPILSSSVIAGEMGDVIIEKCEKPFLDKLSVAAQNRYADEKQLCFYRYARQEGTVWGAYVSECQVDVAARFAANPALVNEPALRASLDCDQASTRLETAICSDAGLGRADLALSRRYQDLRKTRKAEWPALARNDKEWREALPAECHLAATPSPESLKCLRTQFENRFTALEDCDHPLKCLSFHTAYAAYEEDKEPEKIAAAAAMRAKHGTSFDCEAPSSVLESVLCQDAGLGRTEMKLARAYYDADKTMSGQHTGLVDSQRQWLGLVNATCPLGASQQKWFRFRFGRPPLATRACVRTMFENRIAQLQACSKTAPQERLTCLNEFQRFAQK